jgi:S1-C subfamily serine protease
MIVLVKIPNSRAWLQRRLVFVCLILFAVFPSVAQAEPPIRILLNNRVLATDTPPILLGGRTMLPLRAIFEALGARVEWDATTKSITGRKRETVITLLVDRPTAWINGRATALEVPPVIMNGRTLVPVRFIAESFGANVNWDGQTRVITIIATPLLPVAPVTPAPVTAPPILPPTPPTPAGVRLTSQEVAARINPAMVLIQSHRSLGSGFFVSPDGLAITNAHVVRGSRNLVLTTHDGERFRAVIQKIDNFADLALLRIETPFARSFPFIRGRSYARDLPVGKDILAFGNPQGLAWTMTRGVVSAHRRMSIEPAWAGEVSVIQHDAAIAPGSSGGPLVNLYGEWVGVNTMALRDFQGFNFAVPADKYYRLMQQKDYSLRDDWFSYLTEAFIWRREFSDIGRTINDALRVSPAAQRAAIYVRHLTSLRQLRATVEAYQPLYGEIQHLHALFIQALRADDLYISYFLDVENGRRLWSRQTADLLFNNFRQASDAHHAEWLRIRGIFGN